jgi:hypothetical protein
MFGRISAKKPVLFGKGLFMKRKIEQALLPRLSLERKFLRFALHKIQSLLSVRRQNAPQRMSLNNLETIC